MVSEPFDVKIAVDSEELARVGTKLFFDHLDAALRERSWFTVVLSGGKTPRPLYMNLATERRSDGIPWHKVHFFWSDERNVPPEHPESNYHMAWETLLSRIPIPSANVHRIRTELGSAQAAAEDYEATLRSLFPSGKVSSGPAFDLVFLGLGQDGHTASLFPDGRPNAASVSEEDPGRWVIAPWVRHLSDFRISLTPRALNDSRSIIFLVTGSEKTAILADVLEGNDRGRTLPAVHPAQMVRPTVGSVTWLVDMAAAARLRA